MKITLTPIAFATCLALGATAAQANDNFVGLTWGQTDNNIQKSCTAGPCRQSSKSSKNSCWSVRILPA